MKNIIYQTPSYGDAKAYIDRNNIENAMIDSHVSGSRTDANSVVVEQMNYEVYVLVSEK